MAKDAKGHGSETRGTSRVQARNDRMNAMFERAPGLKAKAAADRAAADTLAQGHPKSEPVPIHSGTAGPRSQSFGEISAALKTGFDRPTNPNYHRGAVQNAIDSSNRHGQKIGGREAALIHRLLSGGH